MAFNYSRLHTPTNAIRPPSVCILIILLGILRQTPPPPTHPPTPLMLLSPWKPRVAALMSEPPPRTLVQAPGQVMQAAAGHVLTPRHKMAAHFAPRALLAACVLFFSAPPACLIPKMRKKHPHPRWNFGIRHGCWASHAPRRALLGFLVGIKQPSCFSYISDSFFFSSFLLYSSPLQHSSTITTPLLPLPLSLSPCLSLIELCVYLHLHSNQGPFAYCRGAPDSSPSCTVEN